MPFHTVEQFNIAKQKEIAKWSDAITCTESEYSDWIVSTRNHSYFCMSYNKLCIFCPFMASFDIAKGKYNCKFSIAKMKAGDISYNNFIQICKSNAILADSVNYETVELCKRNQIDWVGRLAKQNFINENIKCKTKGEYSEQL